MGPMGPAPHCPNVPLNRLKSLALTTLSPVKSARASYPGSPTALPKLFLSMLKSDALVQLSLLASPCRSSPISCCVVPLEGRVTLPELANVCGFFTRQSYKPGPGDVTVK